MDYITEQEDTQALAYQEELLQQEFEWYVESVIKGEELCY